MFFLGSYFSSRSPFYCLIKLYTVESKPEVRHLTPLGKLAVVKTLALSKLNHHLSPTILHQEKKFLDRKRYKLYFIISFGMVSQT